jgi:hypothetical protein
LAILDPPIGSDAIGFPLAPAEVGEEAQRAARRSLRTQIARLERELADTFVTAFPMGGIGQPVAAELNQPRLLDLGELERVRDQLAARVRSARRSVAERAEIWELNRIRLEQMLLEPGKHRFVRISCADIGQPGCGVYHVKPRLGLIGMLAGWWQVKLSSGCPLAEGRGDPPRPASESSARILS